MRLYTMLRHVQPLERQAQGERQPQRQRLERQLVVRRCSQLTSFLSGFRWRVLFLNLSLPATEHAPYFIYFERHCNILFVIK